MEVGGWKEWESMQGKEEVIKRAEKCAGRGGEGRVSLDCFQC